MAEVQSFRTALNGFNRQDVVQYIAYLGNKHAAEVAQLEGQLRAAQEALAKAQTPPAPDPALIRQLEAEREKNAQLEKTVAQLRAASNVSEVNANEELEAYRRAERTERQARERASQITQRANAVLADAAVRVDEAVAQIGAIADRAGDQLRQYQDAIAAAKTAFQEISEAMYAVDAGE